MLLVKLTACPHSSSAVSALSLADFQKSPRLIRFLNNTDDYDTTTNPPKSRKNMNGRVYIDLQHYSSGEPWLGSSVG